MQGSSAWTTGDGKIKEGRCGEVRGGVGHGLSDKSGVENVGEKSGMSVHSVTGVPHAKGLAGGVLREFRSILVLSRVRTFISRSRSITSVHRP